MPKAKEKFDVYEMVAKPLMERMENGVAPWENPVSTSGMGMGDHCNFISKRPYRGVNTIITAIAAMVNGYSSRYWLSFNKASELGGKVRKGEKSTVVALYRWIDEKKDGNKTGKRFPILRYFRIFNLDQIDGIVDPDSLIEDDSAREFSAIETCEEIVDGWLDCPAVNYSSKPQAFYNFKRDYIHMPNKESFKSDEAFYGTLFHEMTHSTGHEDRLNRSTLEDLRAFGDTNYSQEELVAEFGAAFLCAHGGILNTTLENSAAYLRGWHKKLKNDPRMLLTAIGQAQKAVDCILNVKWEDTDGEAKKES